MSKISISTLVQQNVYKVNRTVNNKTAGENIPVKKRSWDKRNDY